MARAIVTINSIIHETELARLVEFTCMQLNYKVIRVWFPKSVTTLEHNQLYMDADLYYKTVENYKEITRINQCSPYSGT